MDVGGHCSFISCNKLDFLPIKCRFCLSDFCEDHMTPERHSCANLPQSSSSLQSPESTTPHESLPPCPVNDCTTSKGAILVCDKCNKHFCIPHRLPESHSCDVLAAAQIATNAQIEQNKAEADKVKNEKSAYLATLNLGTNTGKKTTKKISQKGRERAAKVKLMKLKGTAKGPVHVPQADRAYFDCVMDDKNYPLFVDQNYSVGRAKEILQSQFRTKPISQMTTVTDYPLESDAIIKNLFELGILINGDVLNIL